MKRTRLLPLAAAVMLVPSFACAALGGDIASVTADQVHMKASLRIVHSEEKYTVREIQTSAGTGIREYATANGVVFGVAWKGPVAPDLRQILGQYFTSFTETARVKRSSHSQLLVQRPELVVHAGGHMRAFSGNAYLPQMLPAGMSPNDIN